MTSVSENIKENIKAYQQIYKDCSDIKMREMMLGKKKNVRCFLAYIEVAVSNILMETTALGRLLSYLEQAPGEEIIEILDKNALGIADVTPFETMEEAAQGMLTGDAILFVDGYPKALKISDKGYPNMGVTEADSEKVIRGSNEGFADSIKVNTALIRKRVRSTKVKVKEMRPGVRSHTNVNLVYMEDLAYPEIIAEVEKRLNRYEIDGVLDSGVIEQLAEEKWYSPFPQFQTTQRPDRAAMAILEGRVVVLSDNSPVALILPTDYNSFIKTSDDYYNRWEVATFGRILRYIASFFAMTFPGLYLAVTNFHTQVLPTTLLLSFQAARQGVPFPAVFEVLLMEISFELLREAGVRLPGAMGNTIGIVGGLIIGQAAVEANLVSPIVVIIVAFTALCSFAIPNEEFAFSFRILKFAFIAVCAWLGYFGFLISLLMVLIHLSHLTSFGIPYLMPFVGPELTGYEDQRDFLWRFPLRKITKRPIYAKRDKRTKLTRKE
ncbi:spore germination protein [Roseburia sp. MUC/MUC-530-WT-4D]|uniref:Spore germination protein n=1 Tax=Roseburia porci TaxID=2605790 RepID=A0A6L5YR81_9FIRM|nr:spore germination protein [Roseburia porci]MCI5517284.1 spore germination protein [Roseburia sp.]MDD6742589.1 spore germination protein [Roseburia porci]MST74231.1 spore germination protein [Roseburia porci]